MALKDIQQNISHLSLANPFHSSLRTSVRHDPYGVPRGPRGSSGSFWILAGAIWSAPPTAALWLSAEPVARAYVPFQLSVAKRAKAAALPPHSKSPTVNGPSYRTPQNEPLPECVATARHKQNIIQQRSSDFRLRILNDPK